MRLPVAQYHIRPELSRRILQPEIHEKDAIDGLQFEFPPRPLLPLPGDGLREIEQRPLAEILLAPVLHLDDELLAVVRRAINVIDAVAVFHRISQHFFINKLNVFDVPLAHQQIVQEINQQILVDFLPEDAFETDIGERIDKSTHILLVFFAR